MSDEMKGKREELEERRNSVSRDLTLTIVNSYGGIAP